MSRTLKDARDTESMLQRLTDLLSEHLTTSAPCDFAQPRLDAESLRRISMTLHRWHELEFGVDGGHVERHELTGKPYFFSDAYQRMSGTEAPRKRGQLVPDREGGALKRLAAIMQRYPALQSYVQGDPRGCALYILRHGDVPAGESADAYYSRGLAVHQ